MRSIDVGAAARDVLADHASIQSIEPGFSAWLRRIVFEALRGFTELLKLGIVVSERTVSRYLRGLPRKPSQTWRTFLVNHLAQFTFWCLVAGPALVSSSDFSIVTGWHADYGLRNGVPILKWTFR